MLTCTIILSVVLICFLMFLEYYMYYHLTGFSIAYHLTQLAVERAQNLILM